MHALIAKVDSYAKVTEKSEVVLIIFWRTYQIYKNVRKKNI